MRFIDSQSLDLVEGYWECEKHAVMSGCLRKISKKAKISCRTPHGKVRNTQAKHHIQESQEASPFPAGGHKAAMNRQESMTKYHT